MRLDDKHIVGYVAVHCSRCEYEDDYPVALSDLDYEAEDVLALYLGLPKRVRAQVLRLLETLNEAVQEQVTGT